MINLKPSYPKVDFCYGCRIFTGVRLEDGKLICRRCDSGETSLLEVEVVPKKLSDEIKKTESLKAELLTKKKGKNRKLIKKDVIALINRLIDPISLKELATFFDVAPQSVRKFFRRECNVSEFSAVYDPRNREHAIYQPDKDDKLLTVLTALWLVFPSNVSIDELHQMTEIDKKELVKICQKSKKIGKHKEGESQTYYLINAHNLYVK